MARLRQIKEFPRKIDGRVKETCYSFVLYPDSDAYNYSECIEWIKNNTTFYVIAEHNRDIDENGEYINKPHTHIYIQFNNPRYADNLADTLGINYEGIEFIKPKTEKGIIKYFTHTDKKSKEKEKIKYDWKEFITNRKLDKYFQIEEKEELTESEKISMLRNFILSFDGIIDGDDVNEYAINNGLWSEWRRSRNCLMDTIKKHNHWVQCYGEEEYEYQQFQKYKQIYKETNGVPVGFYRADNEPF